MDAIKRSEEQSPLLRHARESSASQSSSITSDTANEELDAMDEGGSLNISRSRGALIVGSIGFLIFLQGNIITCFFLSTRFPTKSASTPSIVSLGYLYPFSIVAFAPLVGPQW